MTKKMNWISVLCVAVVFSLVFQCGAAMIGEGNLGAYGASDGDYSFDVADGKAVITGYTGTDTDLVIPAAVSDGENTYAVTGIGGGAFAYLTNVTSVVVPSGVTDIGLYAFTGCINMISITLPDTLISVGPHAFNTCGKLTSIDIPEGVQTLGDGAFSLCYNLASINLPASLESIGDELFYECYDLDQIVVDSDNPKYSSLDAVLYNKDQTTLLLCSMGKEGVFSVQDSVKTIGEKAFLNCWGLTEIRLPEGILHIGASAFKRCRGMTDFYVPDSVTDIGYDAFDMCEGLRSITVGVGNQNYSSLDGVFYNYDQSELIHYPMQKDGDFNMPDTVVKICDNAFRYTKWENVKLSANVREIGTRAFYHADSIKTVFMADSVVSIGAEAFAECDYLTSVTLSGGLTDLGENVFYECDALKGISIPASVAFIPSSTFYGCGQLTQVTFSEGLMDIGDAAFSQCVNINAITLPSSLETIGNDAFYNCNKAAVLNFGDGLQAIGDRAFANCSSILSVSIPDSVSLIGTGAFSGCVGLSAVQLPQSISTIDDQLFKGCLKLESVTIPGLVTKIGAEAFKLCESLRTVKIPASVAVIEDSAFELCSNMQAIYFLGDAPATGYQTFGQCYDLIAFCYVEGNEGFTNPWNGYPTDTFTLEPKCTIQFNSQGGSVVPAVSVDTNSYLSSFPTTQRPGYDFVGWYKEADCINRWTLDEDLIWSDKTLYAEWIPIKYEVSFIGNGSTSGTMANVRITYDTTKELPANLYSKAGYVFLGWATLPDSAVLYKDKAPVKNLTSTHAAAVNLYAKWAAPIASAASYNYNSIKISWAAADNATSYRIYRATSATGSYSLVKIADSTTRSYVNTGLVTGKTYYYKVSVVAGGKTYHHSAYKSAKAIPTTPTVALSKFSSTSIKVSWSGVSGATKYQIFRASSATGTYTYLYTASSTARSWVNTGLTRGKTYYYKVRAYHLEGTTKVYGATSAVKYLKL